MAFGNKMMDDPLSASVGMGPGTGLGGTIGGMAGAGVGADGSISQADATPMWKHLLTQMQQGDGNTSSGGKPQTMFQQPQGNSGSGRGWAAFDQPEDTTLSKVLGLVGNTIDSYGKAASDLAKGAGGGSGGGGGGLGSLASMAMFL